MGTEQPTNLLDKLLEVRAGVVEEGAATMERWRPLIEREDFVPSALNLVHYLALRRRDLRHLQSGLMPWGLSSLGRLESRVLANLDAVIATLGLLAGARHADLPPRPEVDAFFEGQRLLQRHTAEVFGSARRHRNVRIMVTLPSEAATDYPLVRNLLVQGADCFRINCAHDTQDEWSGMVGNARRAAGELDRPVRIAMDLAGQKPRTVDVVDPGEKRRIQAGDTILLVAGSPRHRPGHRYQAQCSLPEVLPQLRVGTTVTFDDGRMTTRVERFEEGDAVLRVTRTPARGGRLRPTQDLNFLDLPLQLEPLTAKDVRDLDFVTAHADVVGYSFVQRPADLVLLQRHLDLRPGKKPAPDGQDRDERGRPKPARADRAGGRAPAVRGHDRPGRPGHRAGLPAAGGDAGGDPVAVRGGARAGGLGHRGARSPGQEGDADAGGDHGRGHGGARRVRDAQQGATHPRSGRVAGRPAHPDASAPVQEDAAAAGAALLGAPRRRRGRHVEQRALRAV